MADGDGGGGSAEWQPIYDRVQAQAEALAADRARLEAASKVQRESWEAARRLQRSVEELQAAAREKDAEIETLRAEAADASKKLVEVRQAHASRRMRWEAAYVELLLGANQKLTELRDGETQDFTICAETPNSKEGESCTKLSQSTVDQARVASDLGTELCKLKQAYVALSSKKDQEVSALLSEKELARNQLVVMQKDYDALLMNKRRETSQATEAAQKLQRSVDDLKVSAQKKDDEIGRLRAEAVAVEKTLQKMQSLVKEKDDEIERLKGGLPRTIRKRKKMENNQMVEHVSEIEMVEKDGQAETSQKRKCASSLSNVVHFRSLKKPKEEDFCLQMPITFTYNEVVEKVAQQLGVDDPSKIRLTSHNCYSQQPKPQPIKYRGVACLLDMLVHYYKTSDILYYEVLDISLRELKALKVTYHHATKDEVSVHSMILPKNSMVGDVLSNIKSKVELSHPDAELRLLAIVYHKIYAILRPGIDKIECIPDHYWTLHAEEPENFGKPYFMVIHADETLSSIKKRLQKKLKVSDKDFSKWKFAHILRDCPDYFEDSNTVATKFQENIGYWDQYLGLEHPDTAPRKAHGANQFCCLRRRCQRITSTT